MSTLHVDVLVAGSEPAKTLLAMALARAGKQVLLVEDGPGLGGSCCKKRRAAARSCRGHSSSSNID